MNTKMLVGWVVALAAVNWGLIGVLNVNIVEAVLCTGSVLTRAAYILVGVAGVYKLYSLIVKK